MNYVMTVDKLRKINRTSLFPLKKKLQLLLSSQLAREFAMVIGAARHLIWAISTVQILPVANAPGDGGDDNEIWQSHLSTAAARLLVSVVVVAVRCAYQISCNTINVIPGSQ